MAFVRVLDHRYKCTYSQCVRRDEMYIAYLLLTNHIMTPKEMSHIQVCCILGRVLTEFVERKQPIVPTETLVPYKDFVVLKEFSASTMSEHVFVVDLRDIVSTLAFEEEDVPIDVMCFVDSTVVVADKPTKRIKLSPADADGLSSPSQMLHLRQAAG